jgi:uncharacterized phage protein (TIGR02220 family)
MATKQLLETSIWKDRWFINLGNKERLLFLYLLTNEGINPAGMYEIDDLYIDKRLGCKKEDIKKLAPKVLFDEKQNIVWIVKYYQKNSRGDKIQKSVQNTLNKYSESFIVSEFAKIYNNKGFQIDKIDYRYSINTVPILSNDNDNDNDNENENENEKEVIDYLNKKARKNYKYVAANLAFITARMKDGATKGEMMRVIDSKVNEWLGTPSEKFLRPETLFNATKYASYSGNLGDISDPMNINLPPSEALQAEFDRIEKTGIVQ